MTVEIRNSCEGNGLEVRVCEDGICRSGFVPEMHSVEACVHELRAAIRREAVKTFEGIRALEAEAMGFDPLHDC